MSKKGFIGNESDYTSDFQLLLLVIGLLILFYTLIMWIVTSADKERLNALKKNE